MTEEKHVISISVDLEIYEKALAVLRHKRLTPEDVLLNVITRTAQEGALPLKRPPRKKVPDEVSLESVQGSLFDLPVFVLSEKATRSLERNEASEPAADIDILPLQPTSNTETSTRPHLSALTTSAIEEAHTMMDWRQRERKAQSSSPGLFGMFQNILSGKSKESPRDVLETRAFRKDYEAIKLNDPQSFAQIQTKLNTLLNALVSQNNDPAIAAELLACSIALDNTSFECPITETIALIYQQSEHEVCLVRLATHNALTA